MEVGSEHATSSDDGQLTIALTQRMREKEIQVMVKKEIQLMLNKEIPLMVTCTLEKVIRPVVEDWFRQAVKQEIQSALEKFLTGRNSLENETTMSKERSLCLKFLDEVSLPVLTGKVIEGKSGTPIKVALVDKITGQVVDCGLESSSKVEILVLEAKDDDNEDNWSREDFNNRIIREGDKKRKPHLAKSNYIYLKKGIGTLCNTKLGHNSNWTKSCKCRLGARMETFGGIEVQEAWTESFMVSDSRNNLYKKHNRPSLSDQVWRLDKIGKYGAPCQRLKEKKILNVRDFLFLHNVDPQTLQQIVGAGDKIWNATITHAQKCVIDDKRMFVYYPSSESKRGVVFDVVGQLEGAIHDSHYVPNSDLSESEQDCAWELLRSAFEYLNNTIPPDNENAFGNENNIITFDDENALLQQFAHRPSYVSAPTNLVISEGLHDHDFSSKRINGYDHTEPGTSSQIVQSYNIPSGHPNNLFGSANMGQLHDPGLGVPNQSPSCLFSDNEFENFFNSETFLLSPERNNNFETLMANSHSHRKSNACSIQLVGVASIMLWRVRARRRVMALGGMHVQKRQRT